MCGVTGFIDIRQNKKSYDSKKIIETASKLTISSVRLKVCTICSVVKQKPPHI